VSATVQERLVFENLLIVNDIARGFFSFRLIFTPLGLVNSFSQLIFVCMDRTLLLRNGWFVNKIDFSCERSLLLSLSANRSLRCLVTGVASCSWSDLGIHRRFFFTLHCCVYVTARAILIEIKIELRVFNFCGWFELIVASAARALLKLVPGLLRCHAGKVFSHSIILFGFFRISPAAPNVIVHSNGTAGWLLTFTLFF